MIDQEVLGWLIFGLLAATAAALPLWIFFRASSQDNADDDSADDDHTPALRVYQDQLAGIDNDLRWGRISDAQALEMRTEIKRRMLRVADTASDHAPVKALSGLVVSALVATSVIGGGALYMTLGSPDLFTLAPPVPRHAAQASGGSDGVPSIEEVMDQLATHLESNPDDVRALSLMARSRWEMGHYSLAAEAFSRLAALEPDDIDHRISLGEVLLDATAGRMTPPARMAFEEAARIDPSHPAPSFYAGLSHYQAGDALSAIEIWRDLVKQSSPDAPWLPEVMANIRRAEQQLGVPPEDAVIASGRPVPEMPTTGMPSPDAETRKDVETMSDDERNAFIASMVARLEARLEDNPGDLDGWFNLARSYRVLGQNVEAKAALQRALEIAPDDQKPRIMQEIATLE